MFGAECSEIGYPSRIFRVFIFGGSKKFAGPTAQGVLDPAYRFSISDNSYSLIFDPLTGDKINEVYLPL